AIGGKGLSRPRLVGLEVSRLEEVLDVYRRDAAASVGSRRSDDDLVVAGHVRGPLIEGVVDPGGPVKPAHGAAALPREIRPLQRPRISGGGVSDILAKPGLVLTTVVSLDCEVVKGDHRALEAIVGGPRLVSRVVALGQRDEIGR